MNFLSLIANLEIMIVPLIFDADPSNLIETGSKDLRLN